MQSEELLIDLPDDWHCHFRDGGKLGRTVPDAARLFGRALAMPNLVPPVATTEAALAYRQRILAARPEGSTFEPLMALYLTDTTTVDEIRRAKDSQHVVAVKLYPQGATTNAAFGVTNLWQLTPVLEAVAEAGLVLCVHGEVVDAHIDIFDREAVFVERVLAPLHQLIPELPIVLEHVTTRDGVAFVAEATGKVGATITAHHLLINRNDMLVGGIRPHAYCLPVAKREADRLALIEAATSKNPRFFLGTDSAPHARAAKESACGCAGIYTAHAALELYAELFDQIGHLDRLEGFASHFGADFYGLPRNRRRLRLTRRAWCGPSELAFGNEVLVPFRAGELIGFTVAEFG